MSIIKGYCTFHKNLYVGEGIKNSAVVKWKLKHGAGQLMVYVITEPEHKNGQLDIRHCAFLKQKYYRRHPLLVYGIASGYAEALEIVTQIVKKAADAGMTDDLQAYLNSEQGDR